MKHIILISCLALAGFSSAANIGLHARQSTYRDSIENEYNRTGTTFGLSSGLWLPNSKLNALGTHPFAGVHIGMRSAAVQISFTVAARFGKTPDAYQVLKDDSLYTTRHFLSYYVGLGFDYNLYARKRHALDLLTGIGIDGINVRVADKGSGADKSKALYQDLHSLNINAGLGYKFWTRRWYLGLDVRYNALFYNNRGGTDLSGHALTLDVTLGGVLAPRCGPGMDSMQ